MEKLHEQIEESTQVENLEKNLVTAIYMVEKTMHIEISIDYPSPRFDILLEEIYKDPQFEVKNG